MENLTDEQLWLLIEAYEEEKKRKWWRERKERGIDWRREQFFWEEYNPKNYK
jgi:hypothetical protein